MKTRTTIFASTQGTEKLRATLELLGIQFHDLKDFQQAMRDGLVIEDDPALEDRVIATFARTGRQPYVLRELVFSRLEIESAPLATLSMSLVLRGDSGGDMDTVYDMAAGCSNCGAAATQVSALRLRARNLPKRAAAFWTLSREILFSQQVRDELIQAVPEVETQLSQAEEMWTHEPLPWWQVRPRTSLPPFSSLTTGVVRERPCPRCGRDGFFNAGDQPFQLAYDYSLLTNYFGDASTTSGINFPPFMTTFECFGNSMLTAPANPLFVANNKVIRSLLSARIRGLRLVPVGIHQEAPDVLRRGHSD